MAQNRLPTEGQYTTAQKGEFALLRTLQRALEKGWIARQPAHAGLLVWLGPEHFHGRRAMHLRYAPTLSGQKIGCLVIDDLIW